MVITADISEPDQMQQAVAQIIDKWSRLDIVFANAGINGVWGAHWRRSSPTSGTGRSTST